MKVLIHIHGFILTILVLAISCTERESRENITNICYSENEDLSMRDFIERIEVVPLETDSMNLIDQYHKIEFYDDFGGKFNAITQLEPIFEKGETIPTSFVQKYEGNITLKFVCDDSIPLGTMIFETFLDGDEEGSVYRLQCEKPQTYMHNFPNGSPYVHYHEDQSDL